MARRTGSRLTLALLIVSLTTTVQNCRVLRSCMSTSEELKLQKEFNSISSPPWATKVEHTKLIKGGGLIGAHYSTDRSFSEIRSHYDQQLLANGYKSLEVKSIKSLSGIDYGETQVTYCKGDLMAELYDPGRSPVQHPFQYSFLISRNPFDCK